jgi:predicted transcriptional regulator YdeE
MELRVEERRAFTVIGRQGQGPTRFSQTWIRPLWRDLDRELDAVVHLARRGVNGEVLGMWGLMSDQTRYLAPWGDEGRYLAGIEANPGTSPPKGWALWSVPEQVYLVAACLRGEYQETYERVMRDLYRNEKYRLAGAAFEYYPAGMGDRLELFVPVALAEAKQPLFGA